MQDHLNLHFRQDHEAGQNISCGHSRSWFVGVEVCLIWCERQKPYRQTLTMAADYQAWCWTARSLLWCHLVMRLNLYHVQSAKKPSSQNSLKMWRLSTVGSPLVKIQHKIQPRPSQNLTSIQEKTSTSMSNFCGGLWVKSRPILFTFSMCSTLARVIKNYDSAHLIFDQPEVN